jgi:hypothetical protein
MPKMALSTTLLPTNHVNTPFQESVKALLWTLLVTLLVPFNESLQLGKELLNWVQIW